MYDTIIIGAGIAGLTAAIYASRKRMKFEIISSHFGGQFMESGEVLNYPGIVHTTGVGMASIFEEQMKFNDVNVVLENVKEVRRSDGYFSVITDHKVYDTKTVIIATGARAKKLGVPGEERLAHRGITYCAICDGPIFANKKVAVIGGGNSALEAVTFLKDVVSEIHMIIRDDKFKGHEYLIESVKSNPKVNIISKANTLEILGDKFVSGIKYLQDGLEKTLPVDGVIIEIGRIPNTELFKGLVDMDPKNHIIVDCQMHTSVPGVFAAGDCTSGYEYQYVVSAGHGCMALLKAARYLENVNQTVDKAK